MRRRPVAEEPRERVPLPSNGPETPELHEIRDPVRRGALLPGTLGRGRPLRRLHHRPLGRHARRPQGLSGGGRGAAAAPPRRQAHGGARSEEHTSELQSLMRISYAVFCLKKKRTKTRKKNHIVTPSHKQTILIQTHINDS